MTRAVQPHIITDDSVFSGKIIGGSLLQVDLVMITCIELQQSVEIKSDGLGLVTGKKGAT